MVQTQERARLRGPFPAFLEQRAIERRGSQYSRISRRTLRSAILAARAAINRVVVDPVEGLRQVDVDDEPITFDDVASNLVLDELGSRA